MLDSTEFIIQSLIDDGEIAPEAYERAREHARAESMTLAEALLDLRLIDHRQMALAKAKVCEYPYIELSHLDVNIRNAELLPRRMAEQLQAYPLFVLDGVATVALNDPMDLSAIDQIRQQLRCDVDPAICDSTELSKLITRAYSLSRSSDESNEQDRQSPSGMASTADEPNVVAVNQLISAAIEAGASDLHLNPDERELHVRVRVDGVLRTRETISLSAHQGIVQRLKVMGKLDLTQSRRPQDGKFRFAQGGDVVDVRLSLIPTIYGENVVCRLLRPTASITRIEELGMAPEVCARFSAIIHRPHGMVLVTGPTGSGKTTTLYTALSAINSPDRNIMTIEDPVEIRVPLLRQVQVNAEIGLTFASALRSMLRQDPDVILVGEIRDEETARIAVQAAMTGHLVLSTLHTNDAVGAVARMRDFAIPVYAINSSIQGVLAQRLVRCVCQDCSEVDRPSEDRLRMLGVTDPSASFRRGIGCTRCMNTGYRGRLGVHELFSMTSDLRRMVEEGATQVDLQQEAIRSGMKTLLQDGLAKAMMGQTTIDEVEKLMATIEVVIRPGIAA
ncbi:MAG: type II/IV secretion system protein [Phycisphaeraceae bacterium]|nr:type II/IV secretion system protein [Phycisphaeraceae bacterium]MCW5762463.1 type II/IV secretion system protein [Phycisphaeraceae bacterium]